MDDANIKDLEVRIKRLETEKEMLLERLRSLEGEHGIVKQKVNHLELKVQGLEREAGHPSTPATPVEAFINLGALFDLVQNMMYRRVFADTFIAEGDYQVKDILDELPKTGSETDVTRWQKLQEELNWNWKHLHAIKHGKRIRNKYAHPTAKLTKESLEASIEFLEREDRLRGALSLEVVNELRNMWEKLTESMLE